MWNITELEALAKLYETKFDSNLEDVLYENEIDSIKQNVKYTQKEKKKSISFCILDMKFLSENFLKVS